MRPRATSTSSSRWREAEAPRRGLRQFALVSRMERCSRTGAERISRPRAPEAQDIASAGRRSRIASRPVSRVLDGRKIALPARRPFLLDAHCCAPRATNPDDRARKRPLSARADSIVPIRFCSRWGLPCRPRCRVRGALLPHLFTLTARGGRGFPARRFDLCGAIPGVAPAGRYPAPFFRGARTFLPRRNLRSHESGRPADWREG